MLDLTLLYHNLPCFRTLISYVFRLVVWCVEKQTASHSSCIQHTLLMDREYTVWSMVYRIQWARWKRCVRTKRNSKHLFALNTLKHHHQHERFACLQKQTVRCACVCSAGTSSSHAINYVHEPLKWWLLLLLFGETPWIVHVNPIYIVWNGLQIENGKYSLPCAPMVVVSGKF